MVGAEPPQVDLTGSISQFSSSTKRKLVRRLASHGSGIANRPRSRRPPTQNRSVTDTGWPKVMSVARMRFFKAVRSRIKWSRKRARSRWARTSGVGSQISGTSSRRASSARTRASIWSVFGCQWSQALGLDRVRDRHVPAVPLEGVVDEARAGHRLDDGAHLLPLARNPRGEGAQGIRVRPDGRHLDGLALLVKDVHIKALA